MRVWIDYDKRIPAPLDTPDQESKPFDLMDRVRKRHVAMLVENTALTDVFPDGEPRVGPAPTDGTRLHPRRRKLESRAGAIMTIVSGIAAVFTALSSKPAGLDRHAHC